MAAKDRELWSVCLSTYFPRRLRIQSELTIKQYRIAINNFNAHLGRPATMADLTDDQLAGLVRYLQGMKLAPSTINDRVGRLKALWTWLAKRRIVERFPTIEPLSVPRRTPRAWTREELARLFVAVSRETRPVGIIPGNRWWHAFHALAWNTGERVTALLSCRWEWLSGESLWIPAEARKSRTSDMTYSLWPETIAVLEAIREPRRELILPFPYDNGTFYNRYKTILRRAGLPTDRRSKAHRMRVSHATWVRVLSGEHASNLGHASSETTERHYEDPRLTRTAPRLFIPWEECG